MRAAALRSPPASRLRSPQTATPGWPLISISWDCQRTSRRRWFSSWYHSRRVRPEKHERHHAPSGDLDRGLSAGCQVQLDIARHSLPFRQRVALRRKEAKAIDSPDFPAPNGVVVDRLQHLPGDIVHPLRLMPAHLGDERPLADFAVPEHAHAALRAAPGEGHHVLLRLRPLTDYLSFEVNGQPRGALALPYGQLLRIFARFFSRSIRP